MNKEINEAEWLRMRRLGIGGSDIGAIIGLNPWKTPLDVFLEKTGQSPATEPNESMMLGTALEPFIVKRYEEATGYKCVEQEGMYHDGCVVANVDRIVDLGNGRTQDGNIIISKKILEAKTSRHEWEDGVPNSYEAQVHWYMGPFEEVESADVAVYYTNGCKDPFHIFTVMRDDDVYAFLKEKAEQFWRDYVLTGKMPPPTNEDDCRRIWARESPKKVTVADAQILSAIDSIRKLKARMDEIEEEQALLYTKVMKAMGDSEILKGESGKVIATWKAPKDSVEVNWEGVATALHADDKLIAQFTTIKQNSRRFVIK